MRGLLDRAVGIVLHAVLVGVGSLPPRLARELCAAVASVYASFGGPRVRDARVNLAIAFPELSLAAREQILRASFANLGRSFAELCGMHGRHRETLFKQVTIRGEENLRRAGELSRQAGALVVTAHFGSWELCAAALAHHGLPVSAVQHGFKNPHIEKIVTGWREGAGLETLSMGSAALGLFRALARGRYVALLMDQNAGLNEGVFAPFFSRPASTRRGPAQIAMTRNTALVPVFFFRQGISGNHIARVGTPLEMDRDENESPDMLAKNVERINAVIEAAVREAPEQWIWSHRRFKTQPPGSPSIYPKRRSILRSLRHALRGT